MTIRVTKQPSQTTFEETDQETIDFVEGHVAMRMMMLRDAEIEKAKPYQGARYRMQQGAEAVQQLIERHGDCYLITGERRTDKDHVVIQWPGNAARDEETLRERLQLILNVFEHEMGWEAAELRRVVDITHKDLDLYRLLKQPGTDWLTVSNTDGSV